MASAFAVLLILTFVLQASTCDGVRLPNYIPTLQEHPAGRDDLIESYFHLGLEYTEILFLVVSHDINLSLRQLKRILKAKGLGRRRNASDLREVVQAVEEKLRGSGSNVGYGQMTQRLVNDPCIVVAKETVRELLKILDPEGVELRASTLFTVCGNLEELQGLSELIAELRMDMSQRYKGLLDEMVKMIGRGMTVSYIENQFLSNETKPGGVYWGRTAPNGG
ncbi:hypothetical protein AWC38_SpisGene638 [Stylophora pistillata]|uniref:Uncharacterized protein n=1 Tax=Stylophora pistillata TaxID=50429 RepID=A0A2B4SUX6_STYPI|nr:hypothetical protein AWC38_SpisGene638 [Stylophora pistillata]